MAAYTSTERANRDLDSIHDFIAADDPGAARNLLERISEACSMLADAPHAGRRRDDLGRSMRSFPVERYMVYYRITRQGINIIRVLHGARDTERVFRRKQSHSPV